MDFLILLAIFIMVAGKTVICQVIAMQRTLKTIATFGSSKVSDADFGEVVIPRNCGLELTFLHI